MDHAPQPAPATLKRKTKLNKTERYRTQILAGLEAGQSQRQVAAKLGISASSICTWLDTVDQEKHQLTRFRSTRADALSQIQGKALSVQAKILDQLNDDGLLATLTPQQKGNLLHALVVTNGNAFDKERLETGQSTQNISTISKMLDNQVSTLFKRQVIPHIDSNASIIPDKPKNVE